MKISMVTATFPYGNGESFIGPEIHELVNMGHEVTVVPRSAPGKLRLPEYLRGRIRIANQGLADPVVLRALLGMLVRSPVQLLRSVPGLFGSGFSRGLKNLCVVPKAAWLARELRRSGAEHVHVHWASTSATLAMLASRWSGVPFSMTCHQWDIYEDNLLAAKVREAVVSRFISQRGLAAAVERGADPARCVVIHMGPGFACEAPRGVWQGEGVFHIAHPASLLDVKGHVYLLRAIAVLRKSGRRVRLTCYGTGPLLGQLQELVAREGISEDVHFAGHVQHDVLMQLLRSGSIQLVCVPSIITDEGEFEGIPVALMEAMACGIPVVSTTTGSIPELVPESSGLIVPPRDPQALADTIARLIDDPDAYAHAATRCLEIIRGGWSAARSMEQLLALVAPPGISGREGQPAGKPGSHEAP